MDNNFVIFRTSDGIDFTMPIVNKMFNFSEGNFIQLQNIKSSEFQLIFQYCEHHKYENPPIIIKPLQNNDLKKCVSDEWDADFINSIEFDKVTELLVAADYLKCFSLMDLCYARMALYFRVTPISELKKAFMLTETEFTEHEINEIKEGNNWLMTLTEDRINELNNC